MLVCAHMSCAADIYASLHHISLLRSQVSGLYRELKHSEETILMLNKKYELLKRNSKAYKDDVTAKIGALREQLHDKTEEVADLRRALGQRERGSLDADAGPDLQSPARTSRQVAELREELASAHQTIHDREDEVRRLLTAPASARGAAAAATSDAGGEVEELEALWSSAQKKLVAANQRVSDLQAQVVRGSFVLRAFKLKVLIAYACMHACMCLSVCVCVCVRARARAMS